MLNARDFGDADPFYVLFATADPAVLRSEFAEDFADIARQLGIVANSVDDIIRHARAGVHG